MSVAQVWRTPVTHTHTPTQARANKRIASRWARAKRVAPRHVSASHGGVTAMRQPPKSGPEEVESNDEEVCNTTNMHFERHTCVAE